MNHPRWGGRRKQVWESDDYWPLCEPSLLLEELTVQEREIIRLICKCRTTGQIAGGMGLSKRTVDRYRAVIAEKLDVHSPVELVRRAVLANLFSVEEWKAAPMAAGVKVP